MAVEYFGSNKPSTDGHASMPTSSMSFNLKVQKLYTYIDMSYIDSSHMKSFKNMLLQAAEKVSDFVQEMEESNVRTKKSH